MGETFTHVIEAFRKVVAPQEEIMGEHVSVVARPLTSEEAIGRPEHDDYPLLKGKERMMEARFRGVPGQAYTDQIGNFEGSLEDVLQFPMNSNYQRAVLVATLNAVLRYLKQLDKSCHCKDKDPVLCAPHLEEALAPFRPKRIGMIGHQPRLLERVSQHYSVRLCDRDPDQIGHRKSGVLVEPPEAFEEILGWCDMVFATGTTLVNDTIDHFIVDDKPTLFYGITISGAARLLGLHHYCPLGR